MIQVITSENQHFYGKQLDQMFRMRHDYYILGHGWAGLTSHDGRETDEFDDLGAVYLVSVDEYGDVAASLRLNPTTGPTLLKKFADYAEDGIPEGERCWDLSRWIARPDQRRADRPRWPSNHQRELALGVLEFCQSRGANCLTMLCETRLAERISAYGWPVTLLGAPKDYEGGKGSAVAARIDIGDHILSMTRARTGILQPVLFELAPGAPPLAAAAENDDADIADLVQSIGSDKLRSLVHQLAAGIARPAKADAAGAADRGGAMALLAAFNRMLELAGAGIDLIAMGVPGDLAQASPAQPAARINNAASRGS